MKIISFILGFLIFSFSSFLYADASHPCKPLEEACKAAGFYKGGSDSGKGLLKDCIAPLADGKSVAGIKIEQADAAACKAKIDKMRSK
ncbi:MAG: hypothetical protein JO131_09700 [Gammaproteobacteria bacterium]|nr:hypothetical protein [Gammaproteobacteria bacterium]